MPIIEYKPSTSHWLFPPIIMGVLIALMVVMIIQRVARSRKQHIPFLPFIGKTFFVAGWDKIRLLGTPVIFVLYGIAMQIVGFLTASIMFILAFNLLYSGISGEGKTVAWRLIIVSLLCSVIASGIVWFLFSYVFKVTLP
ncbi:MAG: tripartite tricarboxylate transporter TctB family protein [Treponema sp.]|jgi:hypothetical protein|nr:tripartite tricarboxylate transporter TctB family protein [Treponema sp.]